jgi:hypothetical protein
LIQLLAILLQFLLKRRDDLLALADFVCQLLHLHFGLFGLLLILLGDVLQPSNLDR